MGKLTAEVYLMKAEAAARLKEYDVAKEVSASPFSDGSKLDN